MSWLDGLGGLRDTVRQELVSRQLAEQLAPAAGRAEGSESTSGAAGDGGPNRVLRVLDAGCGQGTQALRLAREGHHVTGVDPHPTMLDSLRAALEDEPDEVRSRLRLVKADGRDVGRHFGPSSFDVVLCHGVLMYLAEPDAMLAALVRVLAPGGLLSLLVRNGDALAMRPGLAGDWAAATEAFGTDRYTNRLGLAARADRQEELSRTLAEMGAPVRQWYGVRVFTDTATDDAVPPGDARSLEQLLAAEEEAGRRDPYRAVAALLHLCAVRG